MEQQCLEAAVLQLIIHLPKEAAVLLPSFTHVENKVSPFITSCPNNVRIV